MELEARIFAGQEDATSLIAWIEENGYTGQTLGEWGKRHDPLGLVILRDGFDFRMDVGDYLLRHPDGQFQVLESSLFNRLYEAMG